MKISRWYAEIVIVYAICLSATIFDVFMLPYGFPISDAAWLFAMFALVGVPLIVVRRIHVRDEAEAGLTLGSRRSLCFGVIAVLLLIVPVMFCNHWVRSTLFGMDFSFDWANYDRLQTPLLYEVAIQLLCVALPEEFFYRGYMQTNLQACFRQTSKLSRHASMLAIVVTSALFAMAHLPAGGAARLLTFFPGLLFGYLRQKSGGILGSIFCHAACNLMMMIFNVHYFAR